MGITSHLPRPWTKVLRGNTGKCRFLVGDDRLGEEPTDPSRLIAQDKLFWPLKFPVEPPIHVNTNSLCRYRRRSSWVRGARFVSQSAQL